MVSTDGSPWFYPDRVSAAPGDTVAIHASGPGGPCRLIARRIGAEETVCADYEGIEVGTHPIPEHADALGCDWPAAFSFTVGEDWPTGYIDLELIDETGSSTHHFLCCRPAAPTPGRALLVLSTNTYHSYNYWGGANSYAHVDQLAEGLEPAEARDRAIGKLSRMRPFAQGLLAPPPGAPRLVNMTVRGPGELVIPGDMDWILEHGPSAYDGSAGFLQKWEHRFVAWAEANGYELDFACDHDFETPGGRLLDDHDTVLLVGHSEYWSKNQRDQLDEFVDDGGNLAIFGGNTAYWKVRWEDDGRTLVAHKWKGELDDERWAADDPDSDATHLWSHPAFGRPEAELTGLSFLYGGYHRLAMCVARGSAPSRSTDPTTGPSRVPTSTTATSWEPTCRCWATRTTAARSASSTVCPTRATASGSRPTWRSSGSPRRRCSNRPTIRTARSSPRGPRDPGHDRARTRRRGRRRTTQSRPRGDGELRARRRAGLQHRHHRMGPRPRGG